MKLFGEPRTVDQLVLGKYYKITYTIKLSNTVNLRIVYGKVGRIGGRNSNELNHFFTLVGNDLERILFSDVNNICPLNIEINKTYLFNIDDIDTVEAKMSHIALNGATILDNSKYAAFIHVSDIRGVLPTGIHNKIMYATAAHDAHNVPNPDTAAAADATKANSLIDNVYISLLGSDIDEYAGTGGKTQRGRNRWSTKYKRSINCRYPKGFSQKQYCKYGRRKNQSRTNLK